MASTSVEPVRLDDRRSVSDGDLGTEPEDKKVRRLRRKRGSKGRFKPYHSLTTEEKIALGLAETERKSYKEKLVKGKPMAPSNTTQFLLEDREARADAEREVERIYEAQERRRVRSLSVSSEFVVQSESASTSGESDADREMDREFETELEEYNRDRISKLSREQMTRELLDKDKEAEMYKEQAALAVRQTEEMRRLMNERGIATEKVA